AEIGSVFAVQCHDDSTEYGHHRLHVRLSEEAEGHVPLVRGGPAQAPHLGPGQGRDALEHLLRRPHGDEQAHPTSLPRARGTGVSVGPFERSGGSDRWPSSSSSGPTPSRASRLCSKTVARRGGRRSRSWSPAWAASWRASTSPTARTTWCSSPNCPTAPPRPRSASPCAPRAR